MKKIAHNHFYYIQVDQKKNILYLALTGCWNSPEEVPFYITHIKEALAFMKPGFSILTDIRELEEYAPSVRQVQVIAQKMMVAAGIYQLAEVHQLNNAINQLAMDMAKESRIPLNIFDSLEDAEAWLEEVQQR
ncbi:hypothetical protein ACFSC6_02965 [Rufibacter sediminis]|uniref:STAS/SEC14 domain-containing protein n=1 Tax=Rufibacter sediminis TaxID=2762756 RepID=A0ABR6VWU6_9BACT|nr:hypothetical protein [Rufibacter sediminis]MBC3541116.1 hypothetical protein [Rufibacter sediminis]